MDISVIMLTYNREHMLSRMIECILAQTYPDFSFLIVDNGSTDGGGRIADSYAQRDGRIRVIHRSRGSIGAGRNTGLDAAEGEYIVFVDDDDTCAPDYLEFLYRLIREEAADVSICGATWADWDEKRVMDAEQALITLLERKRYNVAFPTKMFHRSLFEHMRFPEERKYDDIYLMPKMLSRAGKVAYHGKSKYHFHRHERNNSAWTQHHELLDAATLKEYMDVYEERTGWLCRKFPAHRSAWKYFNYSFLLSMLEKIRRYSLKDCEIYVGPIREKLLRNKEELMGSGYLQEFERKWIKELLE